MLPAPPQVRTLARERLGETPLILGGMGHKVRKKKKRATLPGEAGPGSGGGRRSLNGEGQPFSDRASLVSAAYTYRWVAGCREGHGCSYRDASTLQ